MKITKPEDNTARTITFGVEIETVIPRSAEISVGAYHVGSVVHSGKEATSGALVAAPCFAGRYWRAEADSSIVCPRDYKRCEFVSPVLQGDEGLTRLAAPTRSWK